jgi:tetratricopeptide (TPR) repeat protein
MSNWWGDWDWAGAEKEFQRSIDLNPNSADAHMYYALFLGSLERHQEAFTNIQKARELDPFNLLINAEVAEILWFANKHDQVIEVSNRILELDPNYDRAITILAMAYLAKGMDEEYFEALKKMRIFQRFSIEEKKACIQAYNNGGIKAVFNWWADMLEIKAKSRSIPHQMIIRCYANGGRKDKAFEWLEKAYREHSSHMMFLKVDHTIDILRSDPRFDNLLRRVGFPEN